jgi:hypothetical protein
LGSSVFLYFGATGHVLIIAIVRYWNKRQYNERVHQLFIDFKKAYDSIRREVLNNLLIEFGIPMKLVRLIKMCLNEICSKIDTINKTQKL